MRDRAALVAPEKRPVVIRRLTRQLVNLQSLLAALNRLESRARREASKR